MSSLTYFANMTLENGVMEAARLIRTGQAQSGSMSASDFRNYLCDRVSMMLSCDSDTLLIDVRSFSSFGGAGYEDEFDEGGDLRGDLNSFQTGQSSASAGAQDIVLVRAFYKWKLFTPGFAKYYSNMPNDQNYRLILFQFRVPQRAVLRTGDAPFHSLKNSLSRFASNRDGIAASEFALITPVLITLYFGVTELSDALIVDTRVTRVASTAADLVAQDISITDDEMDNIFNALNTIMFPFPMAWSTAAEA